MRSRRHRAASAAARRAAALLAAAPFVSATLGAQAPDSAARLPAVEVTVTRERGRPVLELPFAVTTLRPDSARPGARLLALDDALFRAPGVLALSRNNPTQDPRISIRGFGARSAFGVRGIHVVRDGIPITLPDGQTPVDFLDLESVGRIDVLRGSAAALYGNAAGGVIELHSAEPPAEGAAGELRASAGKDEPSRGVATAAGRAGRVGWLASATHLDGDAGRAHARQRATTLFGRATTVLGGTRLALTATGYDMPLGENPGALTAAQMRDDPTQADAASVRTDARKTVRHALVGLTAGRGGGGRELAGVLFASTRALDNPLPFAVIDVDRATVGGGVRGALPLALPGAPHRLRAGIDVQRQDDDRRNFENCVDRTAPPTAPTDECPVVGAERGVVTIDQREVVTGVGAFVHDEIALGARVRLTAGVRYDRVAFDVRDARLEDGDASGSRTLHATSPMAGLVVRLAPLASAYASVSAAFETPTVTELATQPDGSAGLNPELRPQRSTTWEGGVRGATTGGARWDAALFLTRVRDELVPYEVEGGGGRRYFRNAGRTTRRGAELAAEIPIGAVELAATYAWSRFVFDEYSLTAAGVTTDYAGNRLPGIPEHLVQGSATWRRGALFVAAEGVAASAVHPDDANGGRVNGYEVLHLRAGLRPRPAGAALAPVIGVRNVLDRRYASSLVVNAQGGRWFEPAPGRTWFVGLGIAAGR